MRLCWILWQLIPEKVAINALLILKARKLVLSQMNILGEIPEITMKEIPEIPLIRIPEITQEEIQEVSLEEIQQVTPEEIQEITLKGAQEINQEEIQEITLKGDQEITLEETQEITLEETQEIAQAGIPEVNLGIQEVIQARVTGTQVTQIEVHGSFLAMISVTNFQEIN